MVTIMIHSDIHYNKEALTYFTQERNKEAKNILTINGNMQQNMLPLQISPFSSGLLSGMP